MGMVLSQYFTDDTGGFFVGRVGANAHVLHGKEDAPVNRFEAIANIRDGAGDNDTHGVIEVSSAHLLVDADRLKVAAVVYDSLFNGIFRLFSHILFFRCSQKS